MRAWQTDEDIERIAAEAIAADDVKTLLLVVIVASLHHENREWATQLALELARHSDATVRGNSILAFSHIARRFRALDESARPVIERGLVDAEPRVLHKARDAAHDIRHFLGWSFGVGDSIDRVLWTGMGASRSWRLRHVQWVAPYEYVQDPWLLQLETVDDSPSITMATWWSPDSAMLGDELPGWSEEEIAALTAALATAPEPSLP